MFGKTRINDPYDTMGNVTVKTRKAKPDLSQADRHAARWAHKATKQYGCITRNQILEAARYEEKNNRLLAYGLRKIAGEMKPGEVLSGATAEGKKWWK